MGRNTGSSVMQTGTSTGESDPIYTWYCQQHNVWGQSVKWDKWRDHVKLTHGNVEQ